MKCRIFLFLISTLFFFNNTFSQSEYSIKWINENNGLDQISVKAFAFDKNGYLWIGTELGLYVYDGINLKLFNNPNLINPGIALLALDAHTGNLIVKTTRDNFVYEIKDENKVIKTSRDKPSCIFTQNQVYAKTNKIQSILNDELYKRYFKEHASLVDNNPIFIKDDFYLFYGTKCYFYNQKGVRKELKISNLKERRTLKIGNELWVIGNGLSVYKNGIISKSDFKIDEKFLKIINSDFKQNSDLNIYSDIDQNYIQIGNRVYKVNVVNNYVSLNYLFDKLDFGITNISYNKKYDIYLVGTLTKGLALLYPKNFNIIYFDKSKHNPHLNINYAVDFINNQLFSTSGWKFNLKTKQVEELNLNSNIDKWYIHKYNNQLFVSDGTGMKNIDSDKKLDVSIFSKNKKYFSFCDCNNVRWINQDKSIVKYVDNKIIEIPLLKEFFPANSVKYLLCHKNKLIIATDKGVYVYEYEFNQIEKIKELQNVNARFLKNEGKGFWVGTFGDGLYYIEDKVYRVKDKRHPIKTIHAIEVDASANLWMTSNEGMFYVNRIDALKNIKNNKPIESIIFTTNDGLLINEFNGGCFPTSIKTKEGILGFPSMKGYVWFDPNKIKIHPFNNNIHIDKILVNDSIAKFNNDSIYVPNNHNKVEVYLSFPYYYNRDNLTVEYKVEGETKWKKVINNKLLIIRDSNGVKNICIRVHSNGFNSKFDKTKVITVVFQPKFTETIYFVVLLGLITLLIIFLTLKVAFFFNKKNKEKLNFLIKLKTNELEENQQKLLELNDEILKALKTKEVLLREVHHRVKNNLQLVMSLLNLQAADKESASIDKFLENGQSRIATMVLIHENLYLNNNNEGKIDFKKYINSLVHNIRGVFSESHKKIEVEVNVVACYFDIQIAIPLGLIVNEIITNSFKHAFPEKKGKIKIILKRDENQNYTLEITDDGVGYDTEKDRKKSSIGLELISLLVTQLQAQCVIETEGGTSFFISFQEEKY